MTDSNQSAARIASALNLSDRHQRTLSKFGITPGELPGGVSLVKRSSIPGTSAAQTPGKGPLLGWVAPQDGRAPKSEHGESGRGGETSTATSAMLAVIQAQADELSEMRRKGRVDSDNSRQSVQAAHALAETNQVRLARERQDMLARLDATGGLLARREEQLLALGAGQSAHSASGSDHGGQQRPRLGEEAAELRTKVAEQGARLREGDAYARMLEGEVARLKSSLQLVASGPPRDSVATSSNLALPLLFGVLLDTLRSGLGTNAPALCQAIWAHQFGSSGLFLAANLTELYCTPSMWI
jgi:hypothetical protein